MDNQHFTITADDAGKRFDKVLAERLGEDYSRTFAQALIQKGLALINGNSVKPGYALKEGDKAEFTVPPPEKSELAAENIPLDILYEDEWLIVVNKPAGMVVHPAVGNRQGTLVNALLYHCGGLPDADNDLRPGIVHRLDKDTSGVMVVAKNDRAMRSLAKQFQKRAVKKEYMAVVKGELPLDNGIIEAPVGRSRHDRKKMDVEFAKGKNARTTYHVLKRFRGMTLVRLGLETGRTHQIRVHMKHIGCPVLGDATYGKQQDGVARQMLHAETIGFTHPDTGKYMEFKAPVPRDMEEVVKSAQRLT